MKNQTFTGTPTSRRFVLLPNTVKAGDPVLVGKDPGFALDDYQANEGGATVLFNGTFQASVEASTQHSPLVGSAVKPGDLIYATGGSTDATTNVTTGFLLSKDSSGTLFGSLDPTGPSITSGQVSSSANVKVGG